MLCVTLNRDGNAAVLEVELYRHFLLLSLACLCGKVPWRVNWPVRTVTTTPVCVEAVTSPAVALVAPWVISAVLLTARAAFPAFIKVCKRQMVLLNSHHGDKHLCCTGRVEMTREAFIF